MLSDRKPFVAIGVVLAGVGVLSFLVVAIVKVMTGHPLEVIYYTPRLQPVTAISALVTFLVGVIAVTGAAALRVIDWYRQRHRMTRAVTANNRWRGP